MPAGADTAGRQHGTRSDRVYDLRPKNDTTDLAGMTAPFTALCDNKVETRAMVQRSIDWIFPFGVMWFGKPDNLKTRPEQLKYKVRGWGNDFMRQKWLQSSCAFLNKLGADFPAEYDEEQKKWVVTMPYPMKYDAETYTWTQERCEHDEYWKHSRKGGPMRPGAYERLRREEWGELLW